jgi:hypothetical protein
VRATCPDCGGELERHGLGRGREARCWLCPGCNVIYLDTMPATRAPASEDLNAGYVPRARADLA